MTNSFRAIEIDSRETWDVLCAIQPDLHEMTEHFVEGVFMIVGAPSNPALIGSICNPETVKEHFGKITPDDAPAIKTVRIFEKP